MNSFLLRTKTIIALVFMLNSMGLPLYACEDSHQASEVSHCHGMQKKADTNAEQYKATNDCFFCKNNACITAPAITTNVNLELQIATNLVLSKQAAPTSIKPDLQTTYLYKPPLLLAKNWQAAFSIFII